MNALVKKSARYGFIVGIAALLIAPLGLGSSFIELLKPVLAPGAPLISPFYNQMPGVLAVVLTAIVNGLVYTVLFLAVFSVRGRIPGKATKNAATLVVVLFFVILCLGVQYLAMMRMVRQAGSDEQLRVLTPIEDTTR